MKRVPLLLLAALLITAWKSNKDAYIISHGDNNTFSTGTSVEEILAMRKRLSGRYVWVRRDGREYIIRDATLVSRAQALFQPQMALAPEQEAVSREEAQLDREADRISDRGPRTAAEKQRLSELHARLRVVAQREKELDEQEEALEREAERDLWVIVDGAIRSGAAKPVR